MKTREAARRRDLLGLVLVVALAVALWPGAAALKVWRHARSLQTRLQALEERLDPQLLRAPEPQYIDLLREDLAGLETDLSAIENAAGPMLGFTQYVGWLPRFGDDVQASPLLLELASRLVESGQQMLDIAVSAQSSSYDDQNADSPALMQLMLLLEHAEPQLHQVEQELDQVAQLRDQLDISELSGPFARQLERLDRYLPTMRTLVRFAPHLPSLLGGDMPQTYLVLAQNSDELRATGGFISGVGVLHLDGGRIVELSFQDSYSIDDLSKPHPPPPDALQRHMLADLWLLRDANWSPDFPTAAQTAASLYSLDQGMVVDGVIAFDLVAVQWLVSAVEPLQVEGYDNPITAANVIEFMKASWEAPSAGGTIVDRAGGSWWEHRKDFMNVLVDSLLHKMEAGYERDLDSVLQSLVRAFREKHLLVHVSQPDVAALLAEMRWDGSLPPATDDYLLVVDSNVGFNKVNPHVEQAIAYAVTFDGLGAPQAELVLRYRHQGTLPVEECIHEPRYGDSYDALMERCYWDYVRVYTPPGSRLLQATGFEADTYEEYEGETGLQVFAGLLLLAPGEERAIRLSYELPSRIAAIDPYRLLVVKQAGTGGHPLQVQVRGDSQAFLETALKVDRQLVAPRNWR